MFSLERDKNTEFSELTSGSFSELPRSHVEALDIRSLEKMTFQEAIKRIGENYFSSFIQNQPGALRDFLKISGGEGKEAFEKQYSRYVYDSEQMKEHDPEAYAFMRDHVFWGKEYPGKHMTEQERSLYKEFLDVRELGKAPSMEEQVSEIKDYFEKISELKYENWAVLDTRTRLEKLNDLERKAARIAHRPSFEVKSEKMEGKLIGYYNGSSIFLSQSVLENDSKEAYSRILNTLFHEGRHAYQFYNLYDTRVEQNQEMVDSWRVNLEKLKYDDGKRLILKELGFLHYRSQPVEVDARVYAEAAMNKLGI